MTNPLRLINKKVKYDVVYPKTSTGVYRRPSVPHFRIKAHNANPFPSTVCPHKYHRQIKLKVILSQPLQYRSYRLTTTSISLLFSHNYYNIPVVLT